MDDEREQRLSPRDQELWDMLEGFSKWDLLEMYFDSLTEEEREAMYKDMKEASDD